MKLMPVVFGLMMVGLGIFFLFSTAERGLGWLITGFASLLLLPFGFAFINTFRSENWLARYSPPKVLIKIRSCLNHRLADDDPVVLELGTSEIQWIRKLREKIITSSSDGTRAEARVYLEIKLKREDLSELQQQIAAERQRSHRGGKWLHYPVQIVNDTIRIEWRSSSSWIIPKVERALEMLKSVTEVRDEEMDLRDYTVAPADKAQQESQILELAERGQHIAAIKLARQRYGYSLKQAKDFVEGLTGSGHATPK